MNDLTSPLMPVRPVAREYLSEQLAIPAGDVLCSSDGIVEYNVIVNARSGAGITMRRLSAPYQAYEQFIESVIAINQSVKNNALEESLRSRLFKMSNNWSGGSADWHMTLPELGTVSIAARVTAAARSAGLSVCALTSDAYERELDQMHRATCSRIRTGPAYRDIADQALAAIRETRTFDHVLSEQLISDALSRDVITPLDAALTRDPAPGWLYRVEGVNVLVTAVYEDSYRASVVNVRAGEREGERWFIDLARLKTTPLPLGSCGAWLRR